MTIRNILHVSFIGLAVFAAAACGKKAPAPAQTPPPAAVNTFAGWAMPYGPGNPNWAPW